MPKDIPLSCRCGRARGVAKEVGHETGNRVLCYCKDCQAFARFLGGGGIMDEWGGTDIFQVAPARMSITEGMSEVRCVRLSPNGLFRFYTECCRTPIGNMLKPGVPFIGIARPFMDHESDGRSRDEVLGKPLGYIHGRYAIGADVPELIHHKAPLGLVLRCARVMLGWWLRGLGKPSPFFEKGREEPNVPIKILTRAERSALETNSNVSV